MEYTFTGDHEFFQECEDARVERFEMFDVETVDVQDADAGDVAPDNEYAVDREDMDGDHESALASCGWGTDEDYGCFGGDDY